MVTTDASMTTTSLAPIKWSSATIWLREANANMPPGSSQGHTAILNQVSHDQRSREEDEAKDEVTQKAMPFTGSNTSGPKGDSHPDEEEKDTPQPPAN